MLTKPSVTLVAATSFYNPMGSLWQPDDIAGGGEQLIEFAGRACYESWDKPRAATATNQGYINNILEVKHLSVLEHAVATMYFEGISRSLTHELVRHRHFSYSQLSQRYVDARDSEFVMPPEARGDHVLEQLIERATERDVETYEAIVAYIENKLSSDLLSTKTEKRKRARQTARAVLGNFTETKVVITGNYRAWRHFFHMRASAAADTEIRELAIETLRLLQGWAPSSFNDFHIKEHTDGTMIAESILGVEYE